MFRYVEWILIVGFVFYYLLSSSNNIVSLTTEQFWQLSIFFVAIAILSCIFPIERPLWNRYAYVFLEIALILAVKYFTGIAVEIFMYVCISKSCFFFRRKRVVMLTTVVGILYLGIAVLSFPKSILIYSYFARQIDLQDPKLIKDFIITTIANYLMISSWVILFCNTTIAEQKSRQRAEKLTQQVESLAARLERVRIARDIHDSLGHTLTNLQIQLALAQELRQQNPERTFKAIDLAKLLADQCVEDVSLKLKAMYQSDFDLNSSLYSLLKQLKHHQFKVHSQIDLPELPLQVSHHLYYIIKEGLINIQKHSNASQVSLQCRATKDDIRVSLKDNGRGFNLTQPSAGFGLKSMNERVRLLGGKLKICSDLGTGTRIQIVLKKSKSVETIFENKLIESDLCNHNI